MVRRLQAVSTALNRLDRRRMPVDIVPATRMMLDAMIDHTEGTTRRDLQAHSTGERPDRLLGSQLAVTDGRRFNQLGIQHYGFLPMRLPSDYEFQSTVHAADERIPIAAIESGSDTLFELLRRYGSRAVSH